MQILSRPQNSPSPGSIGELVVLPVFFNLQGKRCVVAGGTAAAAWKAELLAAAGASVHVYTGAMSEEMSALVAAGTCIHHPRTWLKTDLRGAAIAVADAATEQEAHQFRDAAVKSGVPCNVIDQPAFCQFQFGSIVNRSPVVIGISTDGAAPILGQAIRRRIETILPVSLAAWAQLAKQLRSHIADVLQPGRQRRQFWEHFVNRTFEADAAPDESIGLVARAGEIANDSSGKTGTLTVIPVESDDPEFLTLRAMRQLQMADVIFHDKNVSPAVLQLARREARRIALGHETFHDNNKAKQLCSAGKHVVVLNGLYAAS
ncbi:NAD(P)-dependent oxidoreductase [Phyllobacterium sp. P30BS-XVII]|uniref:siroheme synthase n=1 Tax=Phyllobacterium sp. P30BS-XVII TaxID=2587046 RepID=UPI0015FE57D6|nr:NAD(P)-dependent oxidoreductase [Phyllobacterium sp. P30BS-XVII]MBA8903466.1 siroheme synthase-like protein [Phyllobacterium sp. P30BS-XVII]